MTKRYDLKDFRPETLTTVNAIAKKGLITDGELFYHLNSCPYFHTYNDGGVEETEEVLLPFFRRFLKNRISINSMSYTMHANNLTRYLTRLNTKQAQLKKYIRYFTNFYELLHPSKKFEIILPYFPYKHGYISGCAEMIIRTKAGIRIYVYDFTDASVDAENLNFHGFRLQLAGNIFERKTGIIPTSLACIYPGSKNITYYTYNPNEKIDQIEIQESQFIRRYGTHCAYCLQKNCSPMIDRRDKYGWKISETDSILKWRNKNEE